MPGNGSVPAGRLLTRAEAMATLRCGKTKLWELTTSRTLKPVFHGRKVFYRELDVIELNLKGWN